MPARRSGWASQAGTSCRPSLLTRARGGSGRLAGRKPTPPDPTALAERTINTTDPDTRLMKRAGGRSVQGSNAQVVASPEQVILAARVTQSLNDADQLGPMVAHTVESRREAGIAKPIGVVLAEGGYWNSAAISEVR
jgi:hypothetical protein